MERCHKFGACRDFEGIQRRRHEAFHVGCAAAIEASVRFGAGEGGHGPFLPVDRHHIGVSGQHHPAAITRACGGEEVGLAAIFIRDDPDIGIGGGKPVRDIVDKGAVGVATDRGEADKISQNVDCGCHRDRRARWMQDENMAGKQRIVNVSWRHPQRMTDFS